MNLLKWKILEAPREPTAEPRSNLLKLGVKSGAEGALKIRKLYDLGLTH
jgi:hypothetical protein